MCLLFVPTVPTPAHRRPKCSAKFYPAADAGAQKAAGVSVGEAAAVACRDNANPQSDDEDSASMATAEAASGDNGVAAAEEASSCTAEISTARQAQLAEADGAAGGDSGGGSPDCQGDDTEPPAGSVAGRQQSLRERFSGTFSRALAPAAPSTHEPQGHEAV